MSWWRLERGAELTSTMTRATAVAVASASALAVAQKLAPGEVDVDSDECIGQCFGHGKCKSICSHAGDGQRVSAAFDVGDGGRECGNKCIASDGYGFSNCGGIN